MRRALIIFLFIFLPLAAFAENITHLSSMRIFPAAAKTIIYFDLSSRAAGVVRFVPNENKLIVKFENTDLKFSVNNARFRNANIVSLSARELPDQSTEFYFITTGKVEWTTDYEVNMDSSGTRMRLEIVSPNMPAPAPTPVKKSSAKTPVEKEILKELGKYKDKLQKMKMEQQELIGRSRWDKHQIDKEAAQTHIFTVVIDAGHGGKDSGAVGQNGTKEKEVVLAIAKKIAQQLEKIPGIRVTQTRKGDYYVPLRARLNLARRDDADLFIAVHADAYFNKRASGASVYALSQHGATSEASRWLAQQENHSELDGIDLDNLQDRSRVLRSVLIDMSQTATIRDSLHLGNRVLDSLDRIARLHHKKVEQAPFVVLKSPDIPSILVETGFITNPSEEARLANPLYQDQIAAAVVHGVQSYIRKYAGR